MAKQKQPEYRINLRPYRLLYFPFLLPVAFLLALFNKISPVPFKIYVLRVDRIGQMAGNQEQLMAEMELGVLPKELRVFVHRDRPSNAVLLAMQKRVMPVYNVFLPLFDVCHKLGGLGVSSMEFAGISGRDEEHHIARTGIHFPMSREEVDNARKECRDLGIDPDAPFVPVLGRDSSYLSYIGEPTDENSYRNVDINTFIPAMEYLADRFQVMRMGSVVKDKLKTNHSGILDYSLSGKRTELLDVYLSVYCHFYMSCGSGPDAIAAYMFRRPVLYVNFIPISYAPVMREGSLFILKKYWAEDESRYLALSEIMDRGLADACTPRELSPHNIVIHDNTPDEILDVAREMVARLEGTWEETEEDRVLQEGFWNQYEKRNPGIKYAARIGARFLRDNPYWAE